MCRIAEIAGAQLETTAKLFPKAWCTIFISESLKGVSVMLCSFACFCWVGSGLATCCPIHQHSAAFIAVAVREVACQANSV